MMITYILMIHIETLLDNEWIGRKVAYVKDWMNPKEIEFGTINSITSNGNAAFVRYGNETIGKYTRTDYLFAVVYDKVEWMFQKKGDGVISYMSSRTLEYEEIIEEFKKLANEDDILKNVRI